MSYGQESIYLWIPNRIQIGDGRQIVEVEIQDTPCGGGNIDNLIESTYYKFKNDILQETAGL